MTVQSTLNPRNLREKFQPWVGKKVVVGLRSFHYLCGQWMGFDGYHALFTIGGREQRVMLDDIDTVQESDAAQAEYFK